LRNATAIDGKRVELLLSQLDHAQYKVREQARGELAAVVDQLGPALDRALDAGPPLEVRRRLEALRAQAASRLLQGERLRAERAVEVLERIGTPEARQVLRALAGGAPAALLTRSAQAALRRGPN
jgi:hypothetical protein